MTQRIIKFRAWDEFDPIMYFFDLTTDNRWIEEKKCPIMQFTGLLDKNGKEIYEGDVVSYGTYKHVVEQERHEDSDGALVFGYGFASPSTKNVEVIGNIYEHPHLLT